MQMMTNAMTPAQYFGLDSKSRYRDLFNEIYKLTQVSRVEAEIEDGEIEVEEEEPSEPVDTPEMEEEPNKARENDFPCRPEDLSCKSVRGDSVRQYQARPTQTSLNHFHGLHFSPLSLPPAPLGQLSLAGGYPLALPLLPPPVRPWPHLPPLFMPSLPPPPLSHLSQDAFVPPDEKELKESRGFELKVLFSVDPSPLRVNWILRYLDFMASRGEPLSACPSMYKEPLDLYRLYRAVGDQGGFRSCTTNKAWKKVSVKMTDNFRQSFLWRLLQKQYRKYLLKFEIFDTNDGKSPNLEELCQLDNQ